MKRTHDHRTLRRGAALFLALAVLAGGAMAFSGQRSIDVTYNDIKIVIDGKEYVPKDANGNIVEPFAYNGTTYVPLRAVANAFGKEVGWDGATATVTIGSTDVTWLDTLNTYDFSSTSGQSYNESRGEIKKDDMTYSRGVRTWCSKSRQRMTRREKQFAPTY